MNRIVFAVCVVSVLAVPVVTRAQATRPNVVLILADDLGFSDIASYGSEIHTPALDQLAQEGIRFSNYHTAATCAPARGMLLTGVDSHRNGVPNIPEAIPPSQADAPNYRGTLSHEVVTIATLLQNSGYHTYMTGKWHLGMTADLLPSRRGFERTIALGQSGADNWEQRSYLPIYEQAHWSADGQPLTLPDDFYSSRYFIDKTIEFIDSNRADAAPFFAYIPFQAVHFPIQAPREFTDRYLGRYDDGWTALREERTRAAVGLGLVPSDTEMVTMSTTPDWNELSAEERAYASKGMAVYAGMVAAMDHHIGRLVEYLRETGLYENTVFIFLSDNGSAPSDAVNVDAIRAWLPSSGYHTDYETLGERGSYLSIGPGFGSAAAAPLAYYKFFAHEGGLRVPLIITGPGVADPGRHTEAFAFVTDIAPTILDMAGVSAPAGEYDGRAVEPITGKSLLPLVGGQVDRVHGPDDPVGYELAGNAALFKGDYKIVKDRAPGGDGAWHLYDIVADPGEARDLRDEMPERFAAMMRDYETYVATNRVLPVPDDYNQRAQIMRYGAARQGSPDR